jgi:uncharacterized protein (UPF0332 family)
MDSRLYIKRAENELKLAGIIFKISEKLHIQTDIFDIREPETYYSSVIAHCYFCIFYSAKAYLFAKGIKTNAPDEHKKTFNEFRKFVEKGTVDVELLKIYKEMLIRADVLLHIFKKEKDKRGRFTYRTLPQANREPAIESVNNAQFFYKNIFQLCGNKK